jgi:hypothetical protein
MKKRTLPSLLIAFLTAAIMFAGCNSETVYEKAGFDTDITPDSLKSSELFDEALDALLDRRLEEYAQANDDALERSLTLPVMELRREDDTITLRPAGLLMSLCADEEGETVQCVFAGALKGDIQAGHGGDRKRYGLEIKWAEDAGLSPLAYVDLGVSSFVPVLLVQDGQEVKVLWYSDRGALQYGGDGAETGYRSGVTEDTEWSLESLEMLMEGHERYLEMCRLHPNNYLGLKWLSPEEYQMGASK